MAKFVIGEEVCIQNEPTVKVEITPENPLPVGRHIFQLVVEDDAGNRSQPARAEVIVRDLMRPTAVLDAPSVVAFGKPFELSGQRSSDPPPGKVVKWCWTLLADNG